MRFKKLGRNRSREGRKGVIRGERGRGSSGEFKTKGTVGRIIFGGGAKGIHRIARESGKRVATTKAGFATQRQETGGKNKPRTLKN